MRPRSTRCSRASRTSEEIRAELAELYRRWREHLADALREKEREGVVTLRAEPEAVAALLFALGDGFGLQLTADPEWDRGSTLALGAADRAPPARRLSRTSVIRSVI